MKGIELCADCGYYDMKHHSCKRGCTVDPDIKKGEDVRFYVDCPLPDVQPVKHGKWEHVAGMNSKCSICSHYFPVSEFNSRPFDINFCPACGARMDGDANE